MSFHITSIKVRIEQSGNSTYLIGEAENANGVHQPNRIRLDDFLGNDNGQFQWSGENFTNTAEAVSLSVGNSGQPILKAKLKDRKQSPRDAEVNLSERIENQNGKWVFLE